jgi:hypothetical protein
MSNIGGRPMGSKNQPGHSAGGLRPGAGRKQVEKSKTAAPAPKIQVTIPTGSASHATPPSKLSASFILILLN